MYVATVNYNDPDAPQRFATSLRETGFGVITHHPVDPQLIYGAYADWERFFNSDAKSEYRFKEGERRGYFPMDVSEKAKGYDVIDIKEYYQYLLQHSLPPQIGPSTTQLAQAQVALAKTLLKWIELETPADIAAQYSQPLSTMIEDPSRIMMRILHYPPLTGAEAPGAIRAAEHEDINLITLLPAATTTGLQVRDSKGQWHDIPADPGSIVVNVGDMLQECSRGYYKATTHRVCNPIDASANQSRYSMPLFLHPAGEVVLSERHTAHSYLTERLREIGVLAADSELTE